MIRWKRARDGFVESHCGRWMIHPLYCGTTRPQDYELIHDGKSVSRFCGTQREAKELAAEIAQRERPA